MRCYWNSGAICPWDIFEMANNCIDLQRTSCDDNSCLIFCSRKPVWISFPFILLFIDFFLNIFANLKFTFLRYWLLTKNRANEARKSLAWLRGWVEPHKVDDEFGEMHQALITRRRISDENQTERCGQRLIPFTKRSFLVPFSIVTSTLFVGCFSGKTPLQTYAVEVIISKFNTSSDFQ